MDATAMATSALRVDGTSEQIRIWNGDRLMVVQNAHSAMRPYLHPLRAPDGNGVLTEDAPRHHPWQHGLYLGLNDVNGVGFWTEGRLNNSMDGTFHPQPLAAPNTDGASATWQVLTDWRHPDGTLLLRETQNWRYTPGNADYALDLEWILEAAVDLRFGAYEYGGLFLRMPYRKDAAATALTSEGLAGTSGEGRRARWVAVAMPIDGRSDPAGIALFDHPSNHEHPVPWRIDNEYGIAPSRCIAGPWTLAKGNRAHFRHRAFVFSGTIAAERIEKSWQDFSRK